MSHKTHAIKRGFSSCNYKNIHIAVDGEVCLKKRISKTFSTCKLCAWYKAFGRKNMGSRSEILWRRKWGIGQVGRKTKRTDLPRKSESTVEKIKNERQQIIETCKAWWRKVKKY